MLLGDFLGWVAKQQWHRHSPTKERFVRNSTGAVDATGEAFSRAGEAIKAKAGVIGITPDQIKEDLASTRRGARRHSRGLADKASDATVNAAITTAVKARLTADEKLSVWSIGVNTDAGHVSLDGTVELEDYIARAVTLAMETDGVVKVTPHLRVKSSKRSDR